MHNKYLILTDNPEDYPMLEGIDNFSIYRKCGRLCRILRFIHHKINIRKKEIWLEKWINQLYNYDKIVIFDSIFDYTPLEYIRSIRPDVPLICCFRNRVSARIRHCSHHRLPSELKALYNCESWSYSLDDVNLYNMVKYEQFHIIPESFVYKSLPITHDVYFIGNDKNRIRILLSLKNKLDKLGFISKIEVVPDRNKNYTMEEKKILAKSRHYHDLLEEVLKSKCVVDIVGLENYGMTYRCLEAMILKKKLITNFLEIKFLDFYSKTNIFILGENCETELHDFLFTPFDDSISQVLDKYSFKYFCKRIFSIEQNRYK